MDIQVVEDASDKTDGVCVDVDADAARRPAKAHFLLTNHANGTRPALQKWTSRHVAQGAKAQVCSLLRFVCDLLAFKDFSTTLLASALCLRAMTSLISLGLWCAFWCVGSSSANVFPPLGHSFPARADAVAAGSGVLLTTLLCCSGGGDGSIALSLQWLLSDGS